MLCKYRPILVMEILEISFHKNGLTSDGIYESFQNNAKENKNNCIAGKIRWHNWSTCAASNDRSTNSRIFIPEIRLDFSTFANATNVFEKSKLSVDELQCLPIRYVECFLSELLICICLGLPMDELPFAIREADGEVVPVKEFKF